MIFKRHKTQETPHIGRARRLFEAVKYLQEYRTAFELAEHFQIHIQTARLTLNALQQIGFTVEFKPAGQRSKYRVSNVAEFFGVEPKQ